MLKDTILKFLKLDGLFAHFNEYIETRIELLKYELKDDLARGIAKASVVLVMVIFLTLFVLLLSFSIAYYISSFVGMFGGFAILAGAYLLIALFIYLFRRPITAHIEADIKKIMHKHKSDDTGNG